MYGPTYPQIDINVPLTANKDEFDLPSAPPNKIHGGYALLQYTVVLYAYEDRDLLGVPAPDGRVEYVCTNHTIRSGACTDDDYGKMLLKENIHPKLPIRYDTLKIDLPLSFDRRDFHNINYDISNTSLYCVGIFPMQYCTDWRTSRCIEATPSQEEDSPRRFSRIVEAHVKFRSSFGYLTAPKGPLLIFHFVNAGLCLIFVTLWSWNCYLNPNNIVKIQHQIIITGTLMACEQLTTAFHYLSISLTRQYLLLLWFAAFLHALCVIYMPFFLLLMCVGYSVVWETWSWNSLFYWIPLGAGTFFTLFVHSLDTNYCSDDGTYEENFHVAVIAVLYGLLVINFLWAIQRLSTAKTFLIEKKQHLRANVYKKIRNYASIYALVILVFTMNLLVFTLSHNYRNFFNLYWKSKWFFLDGVSFVAYLFLFLAIAYQLRPQAYEQLPQDEDWLDNSGEVEMETLPFPKFDHFGRLQGPKSRD